MNASAATRGPWRAVGTFEGPGGKSYILGSRGGACVCLLSEDNEPLGPDYHDFFNPFPYLELDGYRYIVGKLGGISTILQIQPGGTYIDLVPLLEVKDPQPYTETRTLTGFHSISYNSADKTFVCELGAGRWVVDPRALTATIINSQWRWPEEEPPKREGGGLSMFGWIVLAGLVSFFILAALNS
ncbi:MAG TPA: hypothetical protein VEB18_02450 [Candidatus Paceibacterota bacterium]|nr:hypothetical protein [Candidatus Paceibacterota bacterium]